MTHLTVIALIALLPAAWLSFRGIQHLFQRHLLRAGLQGSMGLALAGIAAVTGSIGLNVYGYQRLTWEAPIAELHVIQPLQQGWVVSLKQPNQPAQEFYLAGDQWRLEAQVIKWDSWANLLGLDSQYRLERLSGRHSDINQARQAPPTAYDLQAEQSQLLERIPNDWQPWVDTHYGNGVYMPLTADTRYTVSISQTGLIARTSSH